MAYAFLSQEWIEAARSVRKEHQGKATLVPHVVRMNLVVTELPFDGTETLDAHLDTTTGEIDIDQGHLSEADLTVTVDYATAKAILVEGNAQAGMQAFMSGKVRVDGDVAKLLALQTAPPDPTALELATKLRAITE